MDIIERAQMLPIDLKLALVEGLLESIGPAQEEIEELWKIEIERRVEEVRAGKVKPIPGEQLFAEIEGRFGK